MTSSPHSDAAEDEEIDHRFEVILQAEADHAGSVAAPLGALRSVCRVALLHGGPYTPAELTGIRALIDLTAEHEVPVDLDSLNPDFVEQEAQR